MSIRVIAKRPGYYNNVRIKEKTEFDINKEADFSHRWMNKVGPNKSMVSVAVDLKETPATPVTSETPVVAAEAPATPVTSETPATHEGTTKGNKILDKILGKTK
jgi:hypothetical protein